VGEYFYSHTKGKTTPLQAWKAPRATGGSGFQNLYIVT